MGGGGGGRGEQDEMQEGEREGEKELGGLLRQRVEESTSTMKTVEILKSAVAQRQQNIPLGHRWNPDSQEQEGESMEVLPVMCG